ncbi:DUF1275 family protein [uncultured Jatrophihabitans sp.]|uniref:DUF1275 family protein n=1 Tax=uncultured Jatrophihabitans sp. TaxID=1610747 RepID=UPI0035C95E48
MLTISTGMVDAVSILALGRVFVANMTGNIVFIGFGLAGAPGFSLQASAIALAALLVGAGVGGIAVARFGARRAVLLRNAAAGERSGRSATSSGVDCQAGPSPPRQRYNV